MLHLTKFKKLIFGTTSQQEKIWGIILNRYLADYKFVLDIRVYRAYNNNSIICFDITWHYDQDIIKDNDSVYMTKYCINSNGCLNSNSNHNEHYNICSIRNYFEKLGA